MKKILYIHGLGGSSQSKKAQLLIKFFGKDKIINPTLPPMPMSALSLLNNILKDNEINLVIGSSLGGFYALQLIKKYHKHTILINPSLDPQQTIGQHIGGIVETNDNRSFTITEKFAEQLKDLRFSVNYSRLPNDLLLFYLSDDDEILDHSGIPTLFPNSVIKFYNNSKHGFDRFDEILPEIKKLYESL